MPRSTLSARTPSRPNARRSSRLRAPGLVPLSGKSITWAATVALALWWILTPKKAYALEIGKKYRYEATLEPPLLDENAALRLGSAIADAGNSHITVSTTSAAYDVDQPRTTELTPGKVLTTFEGSNIVFRTATHIPDGP